MTAHAAPPARRTPATVLFVHHAVDHPGVNWIRGSTRCLLDLLSHIDRTRFTPVVWCNQPAVQEVAATGALVEIAPDWTTTGGRLSRPWMRHAAALVRKHQVTLIHADEYTQAAALVPVARTLRVPLVAQLHRVPSLAERRWSLLHQVDLAVGSSRACISGLVADGFPSEQAIVIYNGVDPDRLRQGDARALRAELGIAPGDTVITMVAYFVAWKAIDVALLALRSLRARRGDCHLVLCGDGPERQRLEAQVAALGLGPWVHFLGDRRDIGAILRDATDVLLSTSRQESFGLTLAEAGVFGIPVVASRIPAHGEVLADGDAGVLVDPDDHEGFAHALEAFARHAGLRRDFGSRLRVRVESTFLVGRYVREFHSVYSRMLSKRPAAYGWWRGTRWPRTYTAWVCERLSGS